MGGPPPAQPDDDRTTARRLLTWAVLALAGVAVVAHLAPQVVETRALDLGVYRMGGRALLDGAPLYDAIYEVDRLPFTYTPFAAIVFVPLALVSQTTALAVWSLLSLAALWRSCVLVVREIAEHLRSWCPPAMAVTALLVVGLLLEPVRSTFDYGQVNLVIMWLVLEDLLARRTRRAGGALTGVATGIKIVPGVYLALLAVTGRLREALVGAATAAGTVLVGFVLVPDQAWRYWTGLAYDADRVGVASFVGNQSLNGALSRILPPDGNRLVWLLLAAIVLGGSLLAARRLWSQQRRLPAIAAVTLGALVASPISWSHHWVWLVVVLGALVEPVGPRWARWVLGVTTVVVTTSRVIWEVGDIQGLALDGPGEQLMASAYLPLALLLLGWFAWMATQAPRPAIAPVRPATPSPT